MRSNFWKLSIIGFAIAILAAGGLGAASASTAAQATAAVTSVATMAATSMIAAPTMAATSMIAAPTMAATSMSAATTAATSMSAATMAATSSTVGIVGQIAPCPNNTASATAAATTNATTSATTAATDSAAVIATAAATAPANAAYLGIAAEQVQQCGARVLDVKPDTGAAKAKLVVGDVIVAIDGKAITGVDDLRNAVWTHKPGDTVKLTIQRGTATSDQSVTLGAIPADTTATLSATVAATAAATAAK